MSLLARLGRGLIAGAATYAVTRTVHIMANRPRVVAHEAGHALLFWRSPYTAEFDRVAVRFNFFSPQAGYTGARRRRVPTRDRILSETVIAMGGLAGELVTHGASDVDGCRHDIVFAQRCLRLAELPVGRGLRAATAVACRRLADDWLAYERLRAALDAHGALEASQMVRLLGLPASRGGRGALDG